MLKNLVNSPGWDKFKNVFKGTNKSITKDRKNIWGQDIKVTGTQGLLGLKNKRKFVGDIEVTGQTPWSKKSGTGHSIYDVNWLGKYKDSDADAQGRRMISPEDYNTRAERNFVDMQREIKQTNTDWFAEKNQRNQEWSDMKAQRNQEWQDLKQNRSYAAYGGNPQKLNRAFNKNFQRQEPVEIPKKEYGSRADAYGKVKAFKQSNILNKKFRKIPVAKYGLNKDEGPLPNPHSQSNPTNRDPQYELNRFITKYVIPKHGGTIVGWKQILNEISFHESGKHQRFDPDTKQKGGGPGRSFAQIEENSAKTNLKRLFSSSTDDAGTYFHDYEKFYDKHIKDKNPQFLDEKGDTITHTDYPELEKLYLSMVDVKTDSIGGMTGWKGDPQPFDVRQISDQSVGILMLVELMGQYDKQDKSNKKTLHLEDYFDGDNLASRETRSELWNSYYNTDNSFHKRLKFMNNIKRFEDYDDEKGIITKWSWPDGYGGEPDKNTPVINYAPFYTHPSDSIDLDAVTNSLKKSFDLQFGENTLTGKTFEELTDPNKIEPARVDNTYVQPGRQIDINRYNKPEIND